MESNFRPEAVDLFSYVMGGLFGTMLVAGAVFIAAFVLCYVVSWFCRCASVWPAFNRAGVVAKVAAWAAAISVVAAYLLNADGIIDPGHVAGLGAGAITLALFYALYTMPRTVRKYREELAEEEERLQSYAAG